MDQPQQRDVALAAAWVSDALEGRPLETGSASMFDRAVNVMVGGCSGVACAGSNGASDEIESSRPGEYEYIDLRRKAKPPLPNESSAAETKAEAEPVTAAGGEDMPVVIGAPEYPSNRGAKAGS